MSAKYIIEYVNEFRTLSMLFLSDRFERAKQLRQSILAWNTLQSYMIVWANYETKR